MNEFTAFVGNLPYSATAGEVEAVFEGLRVSAVRVPRDRESDRPRGHAFVAFADQASLDAACARNGTMFADRALRIEPAQPREKSHDREFGARDNSREFGSRDNRDRDQGYQRQQGSYASVAAANGSGGYQAREQRQPAELPNEPPFAAYFSNLPYDFDEDKVAHLLDGLHIQHIRVLRERETRQSRGKAIVEFKDRDSLEMALTLNGYGQDDAQVGRTLHVHVSTSGREQTGMQSQAPTQSSSGDRMPSAFTGQAQRGYDNKQSSAPRPFPGQNDRGDNAAQRPSQEEFHVLSEEEEKRRPKLDLKPRSKPVELIGQRMEQLKISGEKKQREDPFGGAKPRDEVAWQKKQDELKKDTEVKKA